MKRSTIITILMILALFGLVLFSCSGSGTTGALASSGKIALYLTDDMSFYSQVTTTVNRVQLLNTGSGAVCDVMTDPISVNLANLPAVLQFVNEAACPAVSYNRIHIDFDRNVQIMSGPTGSLNACSFGSYRNTNGEQPNVLFCGQNEICTLDLNGAVNVAASQGAKMALDFDLKNFDISGLGTPSCSVTMKVSPVTPEQLQNHIRNEVITGLVSRLNTTDKTFELVRGTRTFSVQYSAVPTSEQPGIDVLLQAAQDNGLRTKVFARSIDLTNNRIAATAIIVKVEGTVSDLVAGATFTVHYDGAKTMVVDESRALLEGVPEDGSWVDVKLFGWNSVNGLFLADSVEVEQPGTMTED